MSRRIDRRRRPGMEGLESRRLLAAAFNEYALGAAGSVPESIATGPDGKLWFTERQVSAGESVGAIGSIDPASHVVDEYAVLTPDSIALNSAGGLVTGPDGNLWFTEGDSGKLGIFNPTTHDVLELAPPTANGAPAGITVGPDGNIWFTETASDKLGMVNPATHVVTEVAIPGPAGAPRGITSAGGGLWFAESALGTIERYDPTTHAFVAAQLGAPTVDPSSLTTGPDGQPWFTEVGPGRVGLVDLSTFAASEYASTATTGITAGHDGNLWYTIPGGLGAINTASHQMGTVGIPFLATHPSEGDPSAIATAPDGSLWFTLIGHIGVARIIPANQAAIASNVYSDPAGNGTFQGGPLAGRLVYIDFASTGSYQPGDPVTSTDADGAYTFTGLASGFYTVRLLAFPGDSPSGPAGAGQTVATAAGQVADAITIGVVSTSAVLPLTFSATPFGLHNPDVATAEVNALYRIILGRAPEPAALSSAVAQLKSGRTVASLASALLSSTEYDTDLVVADYKNYLGRSPSSAEIGGIVAALQGGLTAEALAGDLLGSAEFSAEHPVDVNFIRTAYVDTLGRAPSSGELSAVQALLNAGTTRSAVTQALLNSLEAQDRAVDGLFSFFYGRSPSPTELANWTFLIQAGTPLIDLTIDFAGSSEFASRAGSTVG